MAVQFYPEARSVQGYQCLQLLHLRLQFLMYAPQYGCKLLYTTGCFFHWS